MRPTSLITSTANPKIKLARKLRERKERQESGLAYIEGLRIVIEAAQHGAAIQTLLLAPHLLSSEKGRSIAEDLLNRGAEVLEVSDEVFKSLALKDDPQGIAAIVSQSWQRLDEVHLQTGEVWVALEAVADPGNLGTILRTCDGVGAKGVILLDNSTDPYDPTAMRASMGALFTQKLVKSSFETFSTWKTAQKIPLVGTSGAAKNDYHSFQYPGLFILFMGNERHGLSEKAMTLCDQVVRIPMHGQSDSLNLAVATAVVLYEIYNHQRDAIGEKKG